MRKNNRAYAFRLIVAAYAFTALFPFMSFAAEGSEIKISTAEELMELSKNCSLDTWSKGKRVVLEADISLEDTDFRPIPTFGGVFEGNGHTISGLLLSENVSYQGLFRYIQQGAAVQNLNVTGRVSADGEQAYLGGIAGSNEGKISECSFAGTVLGKTQVGGIVGINRVTGSVYHCRASGKVEGERSTGGIAGENEGILTGCENKSAVNTLHEDKTQSLENFGDMNQEDLLDTTTDTGGIAGYSTGSLQSCTNTGSIGYPHVGYNVGGVAGRSAGYLDGCRNAGSVLGRKDTGGVIGQMEPDVRMIFGADTADKLENEINRLYDMIGSAEDKMESKTDAISDRLEKISKLADTAADDVSEIADGMENWGESAIGTVNDVSDTIADTIDRLKGILASGKPISDTVSQGFDGLEKALDVLAEASGLGGKGIDGISKAVDTMRETDLKASFDGINDALGELSDALENKSGDAAKAMDHLGNATASLSDGLEKCGETVKDIVKLFEESGLDADDLQDLFRYLDYLAEEFINAARAADEIRTDIKNIIDKMPDWEQVRQKASVLVDALSKISGTNTAFINGVAVLQKETTGTQQTGFSDILEKSAGDTEKMLVDIQKVFKELAVSGIPEFVGETEKPDEANEAVDSSSETDGGAETQNAAGGTEGVEAYEKLAESVQKLNGILEGSTDIADNTGGGLEGILEEIKQLDAVKGIEQLLNDIKAIKEEITRIRAALEEVLKATQGLLDALKIKDPEGLKKAMDSLYADTGELTDALKGCGTELQNIAELLEENAITSEEWDDIHDYLGLLNDRFQAAADATGELGDGMKELSGVLGDWGSVKDCAEKVSDSFQGFIDKFDTVDKAAEELQNGFNGFSDAAGRLDDGMKLLSDSMEIFKKGAKSLGDTLDDMHKLFSDLSKREKVELDKLGSGFHNAEESLHQSVTGIGNQIDALNDEVGAAGDTVSAEIRDLTSQFQTVTNLLYESISDLREKDAEDIWDDVSEKVIENTTLGKAKNCKNEGKTEGDLNVGGIAGAMAIEYDLDPEDDLAREGDNTLNFHYETRAILQGCANEGDVVSKKDAAGGVLGRMELGYLLKCENYGSVETMDGSYTGGIAGTSKSTIRESFSKCALSGGSYTGGIAGYADEVYNCVSLVDIGEHAGYAGSVAGDWDRENGALKQNRFVEGGLAAVDGVSYAGQAEPVPYDRLMRETGIPDSFKRISVSYVADGKPVESVEYMYGDAPQNIPKVPEKEGYYGVWEDIGEDTVTVDHVLNAVYTPYVTTLASKDMRDEVHNVFLVEGKFDDKAELSAEAGERTDSSEIWDIKISGGDGAETHMVHYAAPEDWDELTLKVGTGNGGGNADFVKEGSCYVFSVSGDSFTVEAEKKLSENVLFLIRLVVLTVVFVFTFLFAMLHKKKRLAFPLPENGMLNADSDEEPEEDGKTDEESSGGASEESEDKIE